jgi:hypothetical protein
VLDELRPVECADVRLGVADVDREEHVLIISRGRPRA